MVKICVVCGKEFKGRNCSKCCSVECQDERYRQNQLKYGRKKGNRKNERPKDQIQPRQVNTLCWSCQNATGGCSWSRALKPVKGWKAKRTKFKVSSAKGGKYVTSYIVRECPQYIKDN